MNRIAINHVDGAGNAESSVSGYRQIGSVIQSWIKEGRYRPGDRLPAELELSRHFDVTRLTVRRALDVLEARALICRAGRRGTFVADNALLPPVVTPLSQSLRQVMQRGDGYSVAFLGWSKVLPTQDVRTALAIERDQPVHEFRFLRSRNREPLGYFVCRVSDPIAKLIGPIEFTENFHLRSSLISKGYESKRILQRIGAQIADATTAKVLLLKGSEAVLRFRATHFDARDRAFLHTTSYFRTEDYEYGIEFVDDAKIKNLRDA